MTGAGFVIHRLLQALAALIVMSLTDI